MRRHSQVLKMLAAHRGVGAELRHGDVKTLTRAFAVLVATQRNGSADEISHASELRLAELRGGDR